jgi:beta-xylosidase
VFLHKKLKKTMSHTKKLYHLQFNIRLNIAENGIFNLEESIPIMDLVSSRSFFKLNPVTYNADPFLFVNDETLYMFYEEQVKLTGKGVIKMICTKDLNKWLEPTTVLDEKHHLSYPNVFRYEDNIYMLPETGDDFSVKLYKPSKDLLKWTYHKTLLSGEKYVDSSIILKDGLYYLFTTIYENGDYRLMLYMSKQIDGEYKIHPCSPIANGKNNGRCGGSIFENEGLLYRPTQICEKYYGEGLKINKITTLSEENYQEEVVHERIIPNNDKFFTNGGHHYNYCFFKGKHITATDALSLNYNFWEIIRRLSTKIQ